MRKPVTNDDLVFFRDAQLGQVCVGRFQLILHFEPSVNFDPGISVSIETTCFVRRPNGSEQSWQPDEPFNLDVLDLWALHVERYNVASDGRLDLKFSDGTQISIIINGGGGGGTEAYTINHGGDLWIFESTSGDE